MIQFSDFLVNRHVAPEVSAFTKADIPDMSTYDSQSSHWVANFFLNCALSAEVANPTRAYLYNYFRRCEAAFREHALARDATLGFLSAGGQSSTRYTLALHHEWTNE